MYTLLYSKWITNKDLLYSTWNSAQCYVAAWIRWGVLGRMGYMFMYGWVPSLFTWNYHNIVNQLKSLKGKKRERDLRELPWPFCQVRTQQKDDRLWTGKWILTRHQIHGCPDLGPPSSRTERKISVVYKPPRLWVSVIAVQMDYTDNFLHTLIFFFPMNM